MPKTIGELISGGAERAALEDGNSGMMAFLMAMKGVQGIAETLQNMEADSRSRKRWQWEQEDRPSEVARRDASTASVKESEAIRGVLAGKGGYSALSTRGKAEVDAEMERAGELGVGGLQNFLVTLGASKAGGTTGTGPIDYRAAQNLIMNRLESTLSGIAFKDADNPKLVKEQQIKAVRDAYKTNPEAMDETLWRSTLAQRQGDTDPVSSIVYEALKGNGKMSASIMGKAKTVAAMKAKEDATPEEKTLLQKGKSEAADVFSMLEEAKAGGDPEKFMSSENISPNIVPVGKEGEEKKYLLGVDRKPMTREELSSMFSDSNTRLRVAREISLGLYNPEKALDSYTKASRSKAGVTEPSGGDPFAPPAYRQKAKPGNWRQDVEGIKQVIGGVSSKLTELFGTDEEKALLKGPPSSEISDKAKEYMSKYKDKSSKPYEYLYGTDPNLLDNEQKAAMLQALEGYNQGVTDPWARMSMDEPKPFPTGVVDSSTRYKPPYAFNVSRSDEVPMGALPYPFLEGPGYTPTPQPPTPQPNRYAYEQLLPELPSGPANAAMNPTQNQLFFKGQAPSIANDPNGMMLLLKMLIEAQRPNSKVLRPLPPADPNAPTKLGKDDVLLKDAFKGVLQTQGFKTKPKSWNDRAWQPK